jgi:hypothetical protein
MSYGAAPVGKVALLTPTQHRALTNRRKLSAVEKGGSGFTPDYDVLTRTHAEEVQAEHSGEGAVRESPPTTAIQLARTPKKAKPSTEARPSAAEKIFIFQTKAFQLARTPKRPGRAQRPGRAYRRRGFGDQPQLRHNTARPRAEESQELQSARTRRRRGVRGFLPLRHSNSLARRRRPSRAQRPGRAQRGRGFLGFPTTTAFQLARVPKKAKPSAAARPSAAEKGVLGGLPRLRHNTARPRAEENLVHWPGRAQRRRGVRGSPPSTTQHSTRAHRRKPSAVAKPSAVE